jgi:Na+-transporting NADH:ubiquinone oxidoreductase subunit C
MVILSFVCALILSVLASALAEPKEVAKDLDRSKQMMIAAQIYSYGGYFTMYDAEGNLIPAKYAENGVLEPGNANDSATNDQILEVYKHRFIPMLADDKGDIHTFQELNINPEHYMAEYKKTGYYSQPYKLFYKILPNEPLASSDESKEDLEGYVIPVNGYGLWDAIYGYIALKPDGNTVIGISWYDQKETPGLGANISEEPWQSLFPGKKIFLTPADGAPDFKTAPLGIMVVKGKVSDVLGNSMKAQSAVDGMTGATLTGNGVTDAYKASLEPYRPFLMKVQKAFDEQKQKK